MFIHTSFINDKNKDVIFFSSIKKYILNVMSTKYRQK